MSHRNFSRQADRRNHSDPVPFRSNTKYSQRGGRDMRPQSNYRGTRGDDVDHLMESLNRHFTTDGSYQRNFHNQGGRRMNGGRGGRVKHQNQQIQNLKMSWWRVSIEKAGTIGKDLVMSTLKARVDRPFQPYHYFVDKSSKQGIFFVCNQQEADMFKRMNGKIEILGFDHLRILVSSIKCPVPSIDQDLRPFLRDHLVNRRFNSQTFQLDLSNLVDDEELSTLGIYPQLNKIAFLNDIIDIINKDIHMTRQLDLGSNNISHLDAFRNLHLDHLIQLSLASNKLSVIDDFKHLKHFPQLCHLLIKNNPILSSSSKKYDEIISIIQKTIPQLKRIDDTELKPIIRFGTDIATVHLPKSVPHHVPQDLQGFFEKFISEYYRLFDTKGRGELQSCYHDHCILSFCIASHDNSVVTARQYKFGQLIYDSRNLTKIDENKQMMLLRTGKTAVLDFLRVKFPQTKHDGNSFHIDVISTTNQRAIFTINGLFREDEGSNGPVRCFQRTFTCVQSPVGVFIVADHIMMGNATDSQVMSLNRSETSTSKSNSQVGHIENGSHIDTETQARMITEFALQSGMNREFSKLCLLEHNWDFNKARDAFVNLAKQNKIPPEAFVNI